MPWNRPQRLTSRQRMYWKSSRFLTEFSIMSRKPGRPSAVSPDLPGSRHSWIISTLLFFAHGRI